MSLLQWDAELQDVHNHKRRKAIVFGCGTIGIAAAITLKYFGLDQVIIADLSDFRLNIAKKLGFETCNIANNEK